MGRGKRKAFQEVRSKNVVRVHEKFRKEVCVDLSGPSCDLYTHKMYDSLKMTIYPFN